MKYKAGDKVRVLEVSELPGGSGDFSTGWVLNHAHAGDVFTLKDKNRDMYRSELPDGVWSFEETSLLAPEYAFKPHAEPNAVPFRFSPAAERMHQILRDISNSMIVSSGLPAPEPGRVMKGFSRQAGKSHAEKILREQAVKDAEEYGRKLIGIDPAKSGSDRTAVEIQALNIGHGDYQVVIPKGLKDKTHVIIKHDNDILQEFTIDEDVDYTRTYYFNGPIKPITKESKEKEFPHMVWIDDCEKTVEYEGPADGILRSPPDILQAECHLPPMPAYEPPPERKYKCPQCLNVGSKADIKDHMRRMHGETVALGSPAWFELEVKAK